jgi:hypothetical protein
VDEKGNYFIYGYIRVTPDGIDDWLKPQIFEWKKPNAKKGVSKLGVLELLNWEDENGKTHTKMFGDRYYVGNPSKDFTYISTAMLENPKSKPVAVRQLEMIVRDIRKDKKAMRVLERALGNIPHRNPLPIPTQAVAAQAFLKSIVTGVSTATFGVGITATILGSLLVNFLLNTIKNRVSPPTMPPPPKWVMNMTKSYVAAGVKDPKDITDRIQEIWNQQTFEAKVGIYEGEYGKAEEGDDEGEDVEEPEIETADAVENPSGVIPGKYWRAYTAEFSSTSRKVIHEFPTGKAHIVSGTPGFALCGEMLINGDYVEQPAPEDLCRKCAKMRENPDKKEYTKEELELKALEMVFRWAYNKVIKEPGEAFSFFRRKGVDVAFSAVQHAFTMGKTRRHKDDAKKGKGGGDLPYIANPIRSKAQWRLFKSRYPQLFEDWQAHYPVKYGDLPELAEENPLILGDSFVCGNCRRRMPGREKHPQVPDLCRACGDWAIAEGYAATTAENPTSWSSPDGRWRVEEWGPQDFTVVEILSTDPIAAALGEDARVWPARFKTIQGAIRKASKLAGVTYTANTVETILDPTRREGR